MKFNNVDLSQFVKTKLAQELQKSQIGNFVKKKGAPPLTSTVKQTKLGEKPKTAEGIDMGQQVEAGTIPIIYGHVGMSNTQFDLGQKPSDVDAKFVTQEVKLPISEGSIAGISTRVNDRNITTLSGDTVEHFKNIVINDSFVIDPTTSVANFKDIKFEMTYGDGTTNKQSGTISDYNPLLQPEDGDKIEALNDPTNDRLLNDLGDVQAGIGENYVLYWNNETNQWEAKSFNSLLNETGATYDGGAGGTGGSGGDGGQGGTGGQGGLGVGDTGTGTVKYTQFNPPPVHVEYEGDTETETVITAPPSTGTAVVTGKGAPLRRTDQTLPYFTTDIDFAEVDETTDKIDVTMFFPDGIYKELTTTTTTKNGKITLCGTERPITNSGNLNCLTPNITVADDGQTSTTVTRATGSIRVNVVLTTELCGREFVLHETSYTISHLKNGGYKHTQSFNINEMNAGSGAVVTGPNAGFNFTGVLDDDAENPSCNATDLQNFNFSLFDLEDYLTAYPNQILAATNTIKVYAWMDNKEDYWTLFGNFGEVRTNLTQTDEFSISTAGYLHAVEVVKPLDDFEGLYKQGTLTTSAYQLFEPDHSFRSYIGETGTDSYSLDDNRKYTENITGSFGTTAPPSPLVIPEEGVELGEFGTTGSSGTTGSAGSVGSAGTQGSVTVPATPDIPRAEMARDASYSGDGVADTVTLPAVTVTNADALANNTLTISVPQGSLDVVTVPGSVSAVGRNTGTLTLIGTAANLQTCLDSGLKFFSTTATSGDVTIRFYISSSEGNSETTRQIRSEAVTEYEAPEFEIIVQNYVGDFLVSVRSVPIMASVTGATSNDATAQAIAQAINNYTSVPNWSASALGNIVTVTGPQGLGASYNGVQPTYVGTMGVQVSEIGGGVSPSRVTQPKVNTKGIKGKFIPALAFTNTLDASDVSFFQVKYRPAQGDGESTLSEVGLYVGGRNKMLVPDPAVYDNFSSWYFDDYPMIETWENNPAWVFLDYLTNTTFGLGNDIVLNDQQRFDLYSDIWNAAVWCDTLPTGNNAQPAARFNGIFYGAESKFEALQKIADSMFAKFVYLNGNPRLIADGPKHHDNYDENITKLVNQSNASDFAYQSGAIDNIYNVINVKWNNPDNFFRLEEVQYKNQASIAKFGERETTIELTGCTSKQQALWHAAWMYETEMVNSETVTYIAGWDHFDVLPGDLLILNDTTRPDSQTLGGRVVSDNGDGTVTLDRDAGTGSIAIVDSLGYIIQGTVNGTTATISTSNSTTVNTTAGEITYYADFADDAVWNKFTDYKANYRVVAIEESEDGIYAVTAQKHDPDKYTRIWANTI